MKQTLKDLFLSENEEDVRLAFEIAKREDVSITEIIDLGNSLFTMNKWFEFDAISSDYCDYGRGKLRWK